MAVAAANPLTHAQNKPVEKSAALFARACARIPGGVNSPVRAFAAVGGNPPFITRGDGAFVWDADGRRYVDYVCSWGAQIVGHAHPAVVSAVQTAAENGLGFGAPHEAECRFAETLCAALPSLEMVRAVNSGTEATMSAIRTARGHTGRALLVKFAGCYHGHVDALLVDAGSGALTLGAPSSAGVPPAAVADTVVLPYNDPEAAAQFFRRRGGETAAVIVEPIAGNMNMLIPQREFLTTLRDGCAQHGAVLIFDEVMSGFRVGRGGAQELFGIRPDLTCLGKVIGGGLNVAAFGGRRDIMRQLSPLGAVYQAGTLSGNPMALAAGLATLEIILADGFYDALNAAAAQLVDGLTAAAAAAGVKEFSAQSRGGMLGLYCRPSPPQNFAEVKECDAKKFATFFHAMLSRGIYLAPSMFEAGFISAAHTPKIIEETITAARAAFAEIAAAA